MLTLDAATRAEYDAQSLAADKAQAVVSALVDPVSVTVYDDTDAARASGTMAAPWATVAGGQIVVGEVSSFTVTSGTGGAIPAGWTLRFESGARSVSGTFGHSGTDYTWSLPTFETGQGGYLGTVELVAQGNVPVQGDYSTVWTVGNAVTKDIVIGWTIAAPGSSPLVFTPPSSINMVQGGTYDLSQHVSGGVPPYTYDHATFSLPAGTTLNFSTGLITSSPTATITSGWSVDFGVSDSALTSITKDVLIGWNIDAAPVTPGILPTFGVTSALGGSNLPFAFGHAFKQGDVPAGSYVNSDLADWQCFKTTEWPDGSLRHAIIAGRATCSASVLKSIALSVSATNRSGTALTEADLAAAMPTVTLAAGGDSFTLNSLIGTAARHRTVCTGPVMSNWLYRRPIAGSTTLVAWFDVRLYKGGAVEIFPWAENCPLLLSTTNDIRTWTLTIAGVQRFSQSIDIKHHTRIPLINNTAASFKHWSYWVGADPQIEPRHDTAYLMATKLVPNYGWTAPSSAAYASVTQTYSPNWIGDGGTALNSTGWQQRIGVHPNNMALFLSSGADARAYRTMMANGLCGGSWSIHARDEGFGNEPLAFANRTTLVQQGRPGTGGTNGTGDDASHQPQYAMIPWLVTGRWWFLDEALMWVANNYLWQQPTNRNNADGVILSYTNNETRGAAWALLHLAQTLAITPTTHPCYASLLASMNANILAYHGRYITGALGAGAFVNNLGVLGHYSSDGGSPYGTPGGVAAWWCAPWMEAYMGIAFGEMSNLGLPITPSAELIAVRNHGYKFAVGLFGDGSAGNFNWRRGSAYKLPIGTDDVGFPVDAWYSDFGQCYATYCAGLGLNASVSAASGLSIFDNESESVTPSDGSDFTTSFLGMNLAALAYAAEHGATGAAAARARVTSSSSWALASAYNDLPVWGITPRSSVQPQTGLLFPSNNVAGSNIGLDWTGADMVPAHSHTLIWKARYVQQTGYYAVAWHCRADDTFAGGGDYIGSSPYPCDGTVNGNGQALNYGAGFTTHYHELVPIGGTDYIASPGGSALAVSKGVWYSQARTVEVINGGAQVRFRFWPDIAGNPSFVIEQTFNVGDCALSGAALKFRFGASPWTASGSANSETPSGTLRFLLQYGRAMSLAEIQAKLALTADDTTDPDRWYSNINPAPNDVSDKSGKGHHPAWANANRPTLVTL